MYKNLTLSYHKNASFFVILIIGIFGSLLTPILSIDSHIRIVQTLITLFGIVASILLVHLFWKYYYRKQTVKEYDYAIKLKSNIWGVRGHEYDSISWVYYYHQGNSSGNLIPIQTLLKEIS